MPQLKYLYDTIFYINLDKRTDRRSHMEKLIKNIGYEKITKRIQGVDGLILDINNVSHNIITNEGKADALNEKLHVYVPLTVGAIGCALSHRNIWNIIANDDNINSALILEDDIDIDNEYHTKLQTYIPYIPDDFEILFIGYHPTSIEHNKVSVNNLLLKCNKVFGLFGYILTKKGAKKLLNIFPISYQIDTEMSKAYTDMNAYIVKPDYRIIFSEPSEIAVKFGTDIQKRDNIKKNIESFSNIINNDNLNNNNYNNNCNNNNLMFILFIFFILCLAIVLIIYSNLI